MGNTGRRHRPAGQAMIPVAALAASLVLGGCGGTQGGIASPSAAAYVTFQPAAVVLGQADFSAHAQNQGAGSYPGTDTLSGPVGNPLLVGGTLYLADTGNSRVLGFSAIPAVNGQSAEFVLGQADFNTGPPASPPDAGSLNAPEGLASDGTDLVVADTGNNRVLLWNTAPISGAEAAGVVLGQNGDFTTRVSACAPTGLDAPSAVAVTPGGKLIVADSGNNRVLIWNQIPTRNAALAPPDLVLGQPGLGTTPCAPNQGLAQPNAQTLADPTAVWSDGTRLVVADTGNNRILVWNSFPATADQPADLVLGQGSFARNAANDTTQTGTAQSQPDARTLYAPDGLFWNGSRLFVSDRGNNRLLVWEGFPAQDFQPADVVLGQGDFSHSAPDDDNQDGVQDPDASARTLWAPGGVTGSGKQLLLSDTRNNRVLIFNQR